MQTIALTCYGPMQIHTESGPIHLGRRRAEALLALLALGPLSMSRDFLCQKLWPEKERRGARAALSRMLNVLKRALGPEIVQGDHQYLIFDPQGRVQVELKTLERALKKHAWDEVGFLLSQSGGQLFEGLDLKQSAFEDWLSVERMRAERLWSQGISAMAQKAVDNEDFDLALDWGIRWGSREPYDEKACAHLMKVYEMMGNLERALHQFEGFRDRLLDELGLSPSHYLIKSYLNIGNPAETGVLELT